MVITYKNPHTGLLTTETGTPRKLAQKAMLYGGTENISGTEADVKEFLEVVKAITEYAERDAEAMLDAIEAFKKMEVKQ